MSIDVSKAPCSEAGRGYNHVSLVASIGARGVSNVRDVGGRIGIVVGGFENS